MAKRKGGTGMHAGNTMRRGPDSSPDILGDGRRQAARRLACARAGRPCRSGRSARHDVAVAHSARHGRLTLNRFVDLVSTTPAKLFGLYARTGTIAIGSDADLVIWNPSVELTVTGSALHHNVDDTLYEGMRIAGLPETVTLRGKVIVDQRRYVGRPTDQFLHRERYRAPQR